MYEVAEFRPLTAIVNVDNTVPLPVTLSLIQETGNQLISIKHVDFTQEQSKVLIFDKTTRNLSGFYSFAGYEKFEVKVRCKYSVTFGQALHKKI